MTWYEQDDAEPDDDVFARLNEDYDGRDDVERDAVRGGVGEGDDPSVEAAVPASDVPPSVGGAAARPDVSASPVASSAAKPTSKNGRLARREAKALVRLSEEVESDA